MARVIDDEMLTNSLTVAEAARLLCIGVQRVRQLRIAGALTGIPTPYGYLYEREAVERLAAVRAGRGPWWHTRAARQRADAANATVTDTVTVTATP